ncbi:hypothetical protein TNCV_4023571 [Trichonephila clavipes]|nr:hypothetical protein TNCV_4023571 [Trichonephila clavipes]
MICQKRHADTGFQILPARGCAIVRSLKLQETVRMTLPFHVVELSASLKRDDRHCRNRGWQRKTMTSDDWYIVLQARRDRASGNIAQQLHMATERLVSRFTVAGRLQKCDLFVHRPERCISLTAAHW